MSTQVIVSFLISAVCLHVTRSCNRVILAGDGRSTPTRDTTPPTITCPSSIHRIADPTAKNISISWEESSVFVNDDSDDTITKTQTGPPSGHVFSEGVTTISYHARDKSGNFASCSFNVTVEVIRCSTWSDLVDGSMLCNVGYDMRYGTVCEFGCYTGHELVGPAMRECLNNGEWDNSSPPFCQKIQCPVLELAKDINGMEIVNISCTNENYFASKCTYTCIDGYAILPGHNPTKLCNENGTWIGETPECLDTSAPVYTDCPFAVAGYAYQLQYSGHVHWDDPTATDNSGHSVPVFQTSGPVSGSLLQIGQYNVQYSSSDTMNNSLVCSFPVVVKQSSCPELEETPYMTVVCQDGTILGAQCDISCELGTVLIGNPTAVCIQEDITVPVGKWNFQEQPYCEALDTCPTLSVPMNGALQCDTWELGNVCHMTCDTGYVVINDTGTDYDEVDVYDTLIVCGEAGYWTNNGELPGCQEVDARKMLDLTMRVDYGNIDNCSDIINETLLEDLVYSLKLALRPECMSPSCNVTNAQVLCIETTNHTAVEFDINLTPNMDYSNIATLRSDIINKTLNDQLNTDLTIDDGHGMTPEGIEVSHPNVVCEPGSGVDTKTSRCVKCNAGYFYDNVTRLCLSCPVGYYQDTPRQTECIQCPEGKTTVTRATTLASQCLDGCEPGYYSRTGTSPCSTCVTGSYSNTASSTECTNCPGSQTTFTPASTSATDCQDFDIIFTSTSVVSLTSAVVSVELQDVYTFTLSGWLQCSTCDAVVTLSNENGEPLMSLKNNNSLVVELSSGQYDSGIDLSGNLAWKRITVTHTVGDLRLYLGNSEVLHVPLDRPITDNLTGSASLQVGGMGFDGGVSQLHMWSSIRHPSSDNTGTCVPEMNGDLVTWRQFAQHDGSFVVTYTNCDANDNCSSSPCQNGGQCTNTLTGFFCTCATGYKGTVCETEISDCEGHICQNNGTCVDGVDIYTCLCTESYTGELCELLIVDGGWTGWDIAGACSVTCGIGVQQRSRVCNNPVPSNDGMNCTGDSDDLVTCDTDTVCVNDCAVNPTSVDYGNMDCVWADDRNTTRECTPVCHESYAFDNNIYLQLFCGPDTGYTWNIKTSDNPFTQIPSCTKKHMALRNDLQYSAKYTELDSLEDSTRTNIINVVDGKVLETGCVQSGRCTHTGTVVSLVDTSFRRKRDDSDDVMFTVTLTCQPTSSIDECNNLLEDFVISMEQYIDNMEFTVQYNGEDYNVEVNSSTIDGTSHCSDRYVPVMHYCIPCGKGAYASDNYCKLCDRGYYQDEIGHTSCKKCPDGYTTKGLMTRDRELCNVTVPEEVENIDWQLFTLASLGGVIGLILLVAAMYLLWDRKFKRPNKTKAIYCETPEPVTPPPVRFNLKNKWYTGKPIRKEKVLSPEINEPSFEDEDDLRFEVVRSPGSQDEDLYSIEDLPETPISYGQTSQLFRYSSPIPTKHNAWKE